MHDDFMNALSELRGLVGQKVGADVFIARRPGLSTVVCEVKTSCGDGDVHPLRITRIEQNGVQAEATCTGEPVSTVGMVVEGFVQLPALPPRSFEIKSAPGSTPA